MRGRVGNIVFDAPGETLAVFGESAGAIAALYADLLGMRHRSRADWLHDRGYEPDEGDEVDPIVENDHGPRITFECETQTYRPPRWPDPDHPAQVHLDIAVADLDAAHARVLRHGATLLQETDYHRVYADPVGHPFCLYPGGTGDHATIARIVFDCFSPRALAAFWDALLHLPRPLVDTPERVELAGDDPVVPVFAFQHVAHRPPRWPDPAHPQQLHLDLDVPDEDCAAARSLAVRLGALPLPSLSGSYVFADPAGHPFCLGE
jgi:Glyoxalase-like domain